jgi:FkbM family methyltransferase
MTWLNAFQRLQRFGFSPKVIYDIGANVGDWTKGIRTVWPDADYMLFEANGRLADYLMIHGHSVMPSLLGDERREVEFWEATSENATGSSVYKEMTSHPFEATKRFMYPLDEIWPGPPPDLMKLDTQGSELLILKGASKALARVEIIQIEASLHQYNAGAPLLTEVLEYMRSVGFLPFDVVSSLHDMDGTAMQIDFLFCREGSKWIRKDFR